MGEYKSPIRAAQRPDGKMVFSWIDYDADDDCSYIFYVIQPETFYDIWDPPFYGRQIKNPDNVCRNNNLSVTTDLFNNGIITWGDQYHRAQYYAKVDEKALEITSKTINADSRGVAVNSSGLGNSHYAMHPTTPGIDDYISAQKLVAAPPGGAGVITIRYGNSGATVDITPSLYVDLGSQLQLVQSMPEGRKSAPNTYKFGKWDWNPGYLGFGVVTLYIKIPDAPIGTRFPISLQMKSTGTDAIPANNTLTINVMSALQVFIPYVQK
jgi:hypothetical protein